MLNTLITVLLMVLAFLGGMKISDSYHSQIEQERKYALQRQYLRFKAGVDADDPAQPYKSRFSVTPEFMDRLRTNGSATMQTGNATARKRAAKI